MIIPLNSPDAHLHNSGGKGMNLALLARAGFPVPHGFIILTAAYTLFVKTNNLNRQIKDILARASAGDSGERETASREIRHRFSSGKISEEMKNEIKKAYADIHEVPVAVRSSATAEDLPGMSFAGQQDTFLNIAGRDALIAAVINCWSSLWTARAIGYRERNGIPHHDVRLSVVVQEMIESDISGIMFTANPLNGIRNQAVIDASFGLGEALVGGQVDPDQYIVDRNKQKIISKKTGEKNISIRGKREGGVDTIETGPVSEQALNDELILDLAGWGEKVEKHFNFPQDIEWAVAHNTIYLLQSRPVTSLFPLPGGVPHENIRSYFSFASVQGIMEPITPLGRDMIKLIFSGGAGLFAYKYNHETQPVIRSAGERLWVDITPVVKNWVGKKVLPRFFGVIDPGLVPVIKRLIADRRFRNRRCGLGLSGLFRALRFYLRVFPRLIKYIRKPESRRLWIKRQGEELISLDKQSVEQVSSGDLFQRLKQRMRLLKGMKTSFGTVIPLFVAGAAAGLIPYYLLHRLGKKIKVQKGETPVYDILMEMTRGLPHNVTTEMDLSLWETSRKIQSDPDSLKIFKKRGADILAGEYMKASLPSKAMDALQSFMAGYGMRGSAEIDFGRPRWREDPEPLMQSLKSYLLIEDPEQAPDTVFRKGEKVYREAADRYLELLKKTPCGGIKVRLASWAITRYRAFAGLRESPKFHIIRRMGIFREALLESGRELAGAGIIERADDLVYLTLNELDELARRGGLEDLKNLVRERREKGNREKLRRQIPRMILSDGETFYQGVGAADTEEGSLQGSPVSPGVVEGRVRVVLLPHEADLQPGEILVCPGTDPSWTPLFLIAGGLVMEVGGLMTHGSIVAREYGIPAVAGVDEATRRLETGMRIRVQGSSGRIDILDHGK